MVDREGGTAIGQPPSLILDGIVIHIFPARGFVTLSRRPIAHTGTLPIQTRKRLKQLSYALSQYTILHCERGS